MHGKISRYISGIQSQETVTSYLKSKQLLLFLFDTVYFISSI